MAKVNVKNVNAGYWFTHTNPQLDFSNIDSNLYTHLFCGYAGLDSNTYKVAIPDDEKVHIDQFSSTVKVTNSDVKTLLSIGGSGADAHRFAQMASVPKRRAAFIKSSILEARAGDFDGLDIQWLYPSSDEAMKNFEALLIEWNRAVVEEANKRAVAQDGDMCSYRTPLLLVATVSNLPYVGNNVKYPIHTMSNTLDWVNVLSYDFYTPTSSKDATGPSSALFNPKNNNSSANFGIETWIQHHMPSLKLVFGIPFHGWAWELASADGNDVFSKAKGPAEAFPKGIPIEYGTVKKFMEEHKARDVKVKADYVIAYTYSGTTWIAYENEHTIPKKIKHAKDLNLLGYFAWNIAGDDDSKTLAIAAMNTWSS